MQVNIIPVAEVTVISKMTVGQEAMERTDSSTLCAGSTNKGSLIKFSPASSRVKWLKVDENRRFEDHLRPRPQKN
jgi:hypothetical protein